MECTGREGSGPYRFEALWRSEKSGLCGYATRVLPKHVDAVSAFFPGLITWAGEIPVVNGECTGRLPGHIRKNAGARAAEQLRSFARKARSSKMTGSESCGKPPHSKAPAAEGGRHKSAPSVRWRWDRWRGESRTSRGGCRPGGKANGCRGRLLPDEPDPVQTWFCYLCWESLRDECDEPSRWRNQGWEREGELGTRKNQPDKSEQIAREPEKWDGTNLNRTRTGVELTLPSRTLSKLCLRKTYNSNEASSRSR